MKSCEEIQVICSKTQYREATLWEKLQLKFHMLLCKTCTQFTRKNAQLTSLLRKVPHYSLRPEDKNAIKVRLKEKL